MNKGRMPIITSRRLRLAAAIGLLAAGDALAGTITVGGACLLQDAITAAETDTAAGGCVAGSGADTVVLTGNVILTAPGYTAGFEPTGLPPIGSEITIQGNGYGIARDPGAADFQMIRIESSGVLTLDHVTLSGGSGIDAGGIENLGHVTIVDSTISGNTGGTREIDVGRRSRRSAVAAGADLFVRFAGVRRGHRAYVIKRE